MAKFNHKLATGKPNAIPLEWRQEWLKQVMTAARSCGLHSQRAISLKVGRHETMLSHIARGTSQPSYATAKVFDDLFFGGSGYSLMLLGFLPRDLRKTVFHMWQGKLFTCPQSVGGKWIPPQRKSPMHFEAGGSNAQN